MVACLHAHPNPTHTFPIQQQAPEADGHGHDHGHGHHKLTPDELNWRCKIFLTLEEPDFRCGID